MPPSIVQTAILFGYILLGVLCARTGIIKPEVKRGIGSLLVKVTLPCLIFSSMIRPYDPASLSTIVSLLLISFAVYGVFIVIAGLSVKVMGGQEKRRGVYRFGMVFSNVGFMGFPIMGALFGEESLFPTAVYNLAFQVLSFSVGMVLLGWESDRSIKGRVKELLNPNVLASLAGLAFFFLRWTLPAELHGAIARVGDITTPLSMIFIGASLAQPSSLALLRDVRLWFVSLFRIAVAPLIVFGALLPFVGNGTFPIEVPVMIAAMPVAANTAILSEECGADVEAASMLVSLSTLLSLVSIPIFAQVLLRN